MRTTLAEAKSLNSGIAQTIGINACDERFTAILNRAQRRLADMGRWWGTYQRMYICMTRNCVVWPREVANVEGVTIRGRGVRLRNEWYEFAEAVRAPSTCDCIGTNTLYNRQNVCHASQFPWATAKIRLYPQVAGDAGAKIILQGIDTNGLPVRTSVSGTYIDGEQVTLAAPFADSAFTYQGTGLTGVQKPVTKGRINVFALDSDTGEETKIGFWEPGERNPSYRRTYLPGGADDLCDTCSPISTCSTNGCEPAIDCAGEMAEAIVRLECLDVSVDSDWLFITNLEALREGMRAIMHRDKNQVDEAQYAWADAKRILNAELNKYDPPQNIIVNYRPHGTANLDRVFAAFR